MSDQETFRQLLDERHDVVMQRLNEIHAQTKLTNGAVSDHRERIARLEERNPKREGGMAGSIAGSIGGVIAGFVTGLLKS